MPEPVIKVQGLPIDTAQFDFDTGQLLRRGGNSAIDFKLKPVLVESERALNKKRVLWLARFIWNRDEHAYGGDLF